ncbi:c-type cytochrome [Candidimonas nitroreducens]|uniref:Cytochrome C n=1 Tax=Candidimonas nitroreducens TaxID=683354 RepID=A0A225MWW6_9BURK|nr:cytochrome c [Candidimonas nitroreducens]OWT64071.1 cytochrome C [Candidimonas nitroreducens]
MRTPEHRPVLPLSRRLLCGLAGVLPAAAVLAASPAQPHQYGLGHAATPQQVAGWYIDIAPDGKNLPAGSGTVLQGKKIFDSSCAACHGAKGEGGMGDRLQGGQGTLANAKPIKTVGSYWPYATTLYDYIRRAMPMTAPQSLSNDQVYAVSAYVLYLNGLVKEDSTLDAKSLMAVKMPNRDGFISDPRPDVKDQACMQDCPPLHVKSVQAEKADSAAHPS